MRLHPEATFPASLMFKPLVFTAVVSAPLVAVFLVYAVVILVCLCPMTPSAP